MKVSVALCSYNGERYLGAQLDSILNQDRPVDEVVISDDASTDGTFALLQKYAASDHRVLLFRNSTNVGYRKNFEMALAASTGDWVFLADHDDLWKANKVTRYVAAIESDPERAGLVFGNAALIDDKGDPLGFDLHGLVMGPRFRNVDQVISGSRASRMLYSGNFVTGATVAVRRDLFASLRPFPPVMVHDHWLAWGAALQDRDLLYLSECLTLYRKHQDQAVSVALPAALVQAERTPARSDSNLHKCDQYLVERFKAIGNQLPRASRRTLERLSLRAEAFYHMKLREKILKLPRAVRPRWVLRYLLTGRYGTWETRRPRTLLAIIHSIYDCWRP